MTLLVQSQPEAQATDDHGCWNVRTMAGTTRAGQLAKAMKEYAIEVLGISKTRWKATGSVGLQSGEQVVYVKNYAVKQGGVGIMMSAGQREP